MTTHYQPSGLVDPFRLAVSILLLIPLAALLAVLLCAAQLAGWYFIVIAPALAVLPLTAAGKFLAHWSHLRNPFLGAAAGAALGALLYLGQYHALLVNESGPAAIARFDLLPDYLTDTVNRQVISKSFSGGGSSVPWANWFMFLLELALCATASGGAWYVVGCTPYCERCRRWLSSVTTRVSGGSARLLAENLANGTLKDLPMIDSRYDLTQRYGELQVSGCLHGGDGQDATVFLTVTESMHDGERTKTERLAELVAISADELVTLFERCPGLQLEPSRVDVSETA